ncbi:MAG TPA: hypothetical protein VHW66_23425 [Stellaceae bacterium]|nr:hypothetical protein [Stellaceae bacterium]
MNASVVLSHFDQYVPTLHQIASLAGTVLACLMMTSLGAVILGDRASPETRLVGGWGVVCIVLTLWGAATPWSLRVPVTALVVLSAFGISRLARPRSGVLIMLVITLPLWLIVVAIKPSQIDTWLNLLPNAAYLYDHGTFPADGRPESYSFLPGAPYNTQFVALIVSLFAGGLAETAMGLFNTVLQCAAALLFARLVGGNGRHEKALSWSICAAGFLFAAPLNPGFIPRVDLAPYGAAPIAVTLLFAAWAGVSLIQRTAAGESGRMEALALALTLAAMINIKQSGIGLFLAFDVSLVVIGGLYPFMRRRRWVITILLCNVPAILVYAAWRWYVLSHFTGGELKLMPMSQWHVVLLPQIMAAVAFAIFEKPIYFTSVLLVFLGAAFSVKRGKWDSTSLTLCLAAGTAFLFNGFIIFTYVAHFPANWALNAHSYFRYMSEVSLLIVAALVLWVKPLVVNRLEGRSGQFRNALAGASIVLALAAPVLFIYYVRFDLAPPQPALWNLGNWFRYYVKDGEKLALILPGDEDDAGGSMVRGILLFSEPRRYDLRFVTETTPVPQALDAAAASGYDTVLVGCTGLPSAIPNAPSETAAALHFENGSWHLLSVWRYPPGLARKHWTALLPRPSFCGDN